MERGWTIKAMNWTTFAKGTEGKRFKQEYEETNPKQRRSFKVKFNVQGWR
jgi:hypothetical protein